MDPGGRRLKLAWTVDDRPEMIDGGTTAYTFAYAPDGQQAMKKASNGDVTLYFGAYFQLENNTYIKYYFADSRLIARRMQGDVHYYHSDHSPSTRLQTDANGQVVNAYQFDAYGNVLREKQQLADDIGYQGARSDESLGLVYLGGARLYDSASARFLSADTVVPDQYRPQSHDRYAYVENDPINYWDPAAISGATSSS